MSPIKSALHRYFDDNLTEIVGSSDSEDGSVATSTVSVTFGSVQIREYTRIPGDHPAVTDGVPLTFGRDYKQNDDISIDDYEQKRQRQRRTKDNLRLNSTMRKFILIHNFKIPHHEIMYAEKQVWCYKTTKIVDKSAWKKLCGFLRRGKNGRQDIFPFNSSEGII